jgi:cysteinyl-tRNA synthetase
MAYRFFLLSAHYRAPLAFSGEIVENAARGHESLVSKITELNNMPEAGSGEAVAPFREAFLGEINDDLNMPGRWLWAGHAVDLNNRVKINRRNSTVGA